MASLNVGTVCMKIAGREGGQICTVIKTVDKTFVIITGPKLVTGIKRRRCNIEHLESTGMMLDIKEDAADEDIIEAYKKANVITKFNLRLPSAGEMKAGKKVKEEKAKEEKKPKEEPKKKVKEEKK